MLHICAYIVICSHIYINLHAYSSCKHIYASYCISWKVFLYLNASKYIDICVYRCILPFIWSCLTLVLENCQQKYQLAVPYACYTSQTENAKTKSLLLYTYSRIAYTNSNIKSASIKYKIQTNRQKNPNLGISSHPTIVGVSVQLQSTPTCQLNMQKII